MDIEVIRTCLQQIAHQSGRAWDALAAGDGVECFKMVELIDRNTERVRAELNMNEKIRP